VLEPLEVEIRTLHAILGSDRDPDARAFAPLADAYRRAGQPRKAFGLLTDGLARLPDFATGHVVAARLYAEQGLLEEGEFAARRALELDPDNVIAMTALVRVLESAGKVDEAAETRATLATLEPEVLEEEGVGDPPEPVVDIAALAPAPSDEADEAVMELADLAPDEPVMEDDPVMEMVDLAPDEPVLEVAALAPDERVMEMSDLAPDEPVMELADLAPDLPDVELAEPESAEPEPDEAAPEIADPVSPAVAASANPGGPPKGSGGAGGGSGAPRIYTRTLGELYARQGFLDRAVEVFRQLHAENPDDAGLADRLGEIEAQLSRGAAATDDAPSGPKPERTRSRDEELEALARDLAAQRGSEPNVDTPFAWTADDDPEDVAEPAEEGPSIGSYFDELLSWQPKGGE
jgi:tetratricopeptide (TPR) repeat protein